MSYSYYGIWGGDPANGATGFTQSGLSIPAGNVAVVYCVQNASVACPVTVGSTVLTPGPFIGGVGIAYGTILSTATSVNVAATSASNNADFLFALWYGGGTWALTTSQSGTASFTYPQSVVAGDFMFGGGNSIGGFSGSGTTQSPSDAGPGSPYSIAGLNGNTLVVADWTVAASGSFTVSATNYNYIAGIDFTPSSGGDTLANSQSLLFM